LEHADVFMCNHKIIGLLDIIQGNKIMNKSIDAEVESSVMTQRLIVTILAWVLSGIGVWLAFIMGFGYFDKNYPSSFLNIRAWISISLLWLPWVSLGMMNVYWLRDERMHWFGPMIGGLSISMPAVHFFEFWYLFATGFYLMTHLIIFHLYYKRINPTKWLSLFVSTIAFIFVLSAMWLFSKYNLHEHEAMALGAPLETSVRTFLAELRADEHLTLSLRDHAQRRAADLRGALEFIGEN
jgi:hypothetical protein